LYGGWSCALEFSIWVNYFDMLSSLVKEHQAKQASRKEKQGLCSHLIFKHRAQFHSVLPGSISEKYVFFRSTP
jgi:hypothetical protein